MLLVVGTVFDELVGAHRKAKTEKTSMRKAWPTETEPASRKQPPPWYVMLRSRPKDPRSTPPAIAEPSSWPSIYRMPAKARLINYRPVVKTEVEEQIPLENPVSPVIMVANVMVGLTWLSISWFNISWGLSLCSHMSTGAWTCGHDEQGEKKDVGHSNICRSL